MKKNILALSLVLLAMFAFSSCHDDDEVVLSSDCHISGFTLGSARRTAVMTSSKGEDSTYIVTYSAASYCMTIDQLRGTIENKVPLPYNTLKNAILATIETSGSVVYRKADDAAENWQAYSSKDSLDFSTPLVFRVIAADGTAYRDYTATLNVQGVDGDVFAWNKVAEPNLWTSAERLKTIVWNDALWVFAREGAVVRAFRADVETPDSWEEKTPEGCGVADVKTLTVFAGRLYMSGEDGTLVCSDDALRWNTLMTGHDDLHLLTADDTYLYAMAGKALYRSADGMVWTKEPRDDDASYLPERDRAAVAYVQTDGLRKLLLIGNRDAAVYDKDPYAVVWGRGVRSANSQPLWMYYNWSSDNPYGCPRLNSLELVHYNNVLLAGGGTSIGGKEHEALDGLYVSQDNGITWKSHEMYVLPEIPADDRAVFTMTADARDYLWVVTGNGIWKGRLNKLGY